MSRFAINCPRMSQVLPWDMYTRLVVGNTCNIHGCMGLHDTRVVFWATYHGTSWDLAKRTGTVDGKPGHE